MASIAPNTLYLKVVNYQKPFWKPFALQKRIWEAKIAQATREILASALNALIAEATPDGVEVLRLSPADFEVEVKITKGSLNISISLKNAPQVARKIGRRLRAARPNLKEILITAQLIAAITTATNQGLQIHERLNDQVEVAVAQTTGGTCTESEGNLIGDLPQALQQEADEEARAAEESVEPLDTEPVVEEERQKEKWDWPNEGVLPPIPSDEGSQKGESQQQQQKNTRSKSSSSGG